MLFDENEDGAVTQEPLDHSNAVYKVTHHNKSANSSSLHTLVENILLCMLKNEELSCWPEVRKGQLETRMLLLMV